MIISGSIAEARQLNGTVVNRGTQKQNKHSTELNIRVPVRGFAVEKFEHTSQVRTRTRTHVIAHMNKD
jgi:hypothetical protein